MARKFVDNAPLSVSGHKRAINTLVRSRREGAALSIDDVERMNEAQRVARDSDDAREGRRAFAEKRKPVYTGR